MNSADSYFDQRLQKKIQQNQLRQLQVKLGKVDFSSNDYLGLGKTDYSVTTKGSTGSRLLSGNNRQTEQLEQELAHFYNSQAALIFPTGFQANIGLLSALGERSDTFLLDSEIHASMKVGARLSKSTCWKFKHNNLNDLSEKLKKATGKIWVFIEALYSMSGDLAPIKEILALCKSHKAYLVVDEAHSNGVYGKNGEGLVAQLALENETTIRIMTFGKSFGAEGAVILGSKALKRFLINHSFPFIYSTAPSFGFLNSIKHQLKAVKEAHQQRKALFQNIELFRHLKQASSLSWTESESAIQSLVLGEVNSTKQISAQLNQREFAVFPILSPTVPTGKEQIRFCLHSYNTNREIHSLFNCLHKLI